MALTNFADQVILDYVFGNSLFSSSWSGFPSSTGNFYIGLSTTTISRDGTGITEPATQVLLTSALTSGTTYTQLTVSPMTAPIASGVSVKVVSGSNSQTFITSASVSQDATSIPVTSASANFSYPVDSLVQDISNAYARVPILNTISSTAWSAASAVAGSPPAGYNKVNASDISFPKATGDWGTVEQFFISDSPGGGNIIVFGSLSTSKTVLNGDDANFGAGSISLGLE